MKRILTSLILLSAIIFVLGGAGAAQAPIPFSLAIAKVATVVDGDTFDVTYISGGNNLPTRIELYLVNAPENVGGGFFATSNIECYGPESTAFAQNYLQGRTVWLQHQGRTTVFAGKKRIYALVYLDSDQQSLFQTMELSQGLVVPQVEYSEEQAFFPRVIGLANEAKDAKRGIWGSCDVNLLQKR
ncbi:thermonuclease family protein [Candidatus Acetothermia bacterium]|nr:thermonuclease family protein [Candidatus Acetothermia bacterium]MBI3643698.1 thermonuclease family protein [Candidatus Acetothermia bacterium]